MSNDLIHIDPTKTTPKTTQIIDQISHAIASGVIKKGEILPSINTLSKKNSISRDTVFKAYNELKNRNLIDSTPTKGYFVTSNKSRVLLFLDSYSPFKDVLYDSFRKDLAGNFEVDLAFHHYNYSIFETIITNSIGKYDCYVIMNFNHSKISNLLIKIPPQKLLIIDWGEHINDAYSFICQDFGKQVYECFQQLHANIKKYDTFLYVCPEECAHPPVTYSYFERFCTESHINFQKLKSIPDHTIKKSQAFLVFRQKDLVQLLQKITRNNLIPGNDVGILAYNENPLYELILNGITSISADFSEMGIKAAKFVQERKPVKEFLKTNINLRGSL